MCKRLMEQEANNLLDCIDESVLKNIAEKAIRLWAVEDQAMQRLLLSCTIELKNHKFCFKSSALDYHYFESTYDLISHGDNLGVYCLYTSVQGEVIDDYYELF